MAAAALTTNSVLARTSFRAVATTPWHPNSGRVSLAFLCPFSIILSPTTTRVAGRLRAAANSNDEDTDDPTFLSQEDLSYLVKLGAGSVVGAAAIKFGSAIFPDITRPNIIEALVIIAFPVIVAVLLLLRQSFYK